MTQQEYDARMTELNNQMQAELATIHDQMNENRRQSFQLRIQSYELGQQFYNLCSQAKAIKAKYQALKHDVYLERPEISHDSHI